LSAHGFACSPNPNSNSNSNFGSGLSPSPIPSPIPSPMPRDKNTLQPPTTAVVRRRSLIVTPDPSDDEQGLTDPSRAILAYYEIPAPSPPPTGPLPRPPKIQQQQQQQQLLMQPPIQRGRVSPFPSRPILPSNGRSDGGGDGTGGFEGRVKVRRYRELYALANGGDVGGGGGAGSDENENASSSGSHERYEDEDQDDFDSTPRRKKFIANYPGVKDRPPSDFYEEEDSVTLDGVLSRYADGQVMVDPSSPESEDSDEKFYPLSGNEIPHLRARERPSYFPVQPPIPYPPNQEPYNTISVYSTHSIMDNEKSGVTRDRFVKRVQAMYGPDGRERSSTSIDREREREALEMEKLHMRKVEGLRGRPNVGVGVNVKVAPPVPKLPEEFRALHKLKEESQRRRF